MADLRIVFMGTPEFAVPSLEILCFNGFEIVGVITAPDKPKGRGQKIAASPVKEFAQDNGLKVLQPTNLKNDQFLKDLAELRANLQVVVAFRMLPQVVWAMPDLGTFNLHASVLPQYRGAAPINWAIINGETNTGVTTFFLDKEIDTGSLIFQEEEAITLQDDAGSLYQRLMTKGADLVLRTATAIQEDNFPSQPQRHFPQLKKAPKLSKEDCLLDWDQPIDQIYNFIRGLSPYPGAWTKYEGKTIKVFSTVPQKTATTTEPGRLETDGKTFLRFGGQDGYLAVQELQMEGKRRMDVLEFLRGNKL